MSKCLPQRCLKEKRLIYFCFCDILALPIFAIALKSHAMQINEHDIMLSHN